MKLLIVWTQEVVAHIITDTDLGKHFRKLDEPDRPLYTISCSALVQCSFYVAIFLLSFNSKDCIHWGLLPTATKAMRDLSKLAKGRFMGDPSFEFEHIETKKVGEGEDATEEEETVRITIFAQKFLQRKNN